MTSRDVEGGARHMAAQQETRSPALRANELTSASPRSPDNIMRPVSSLAPDFPFLKNDPFLKNTGEPLTSPCTNKIPETPAAGGIIPVRQPAALESDDWDLYNPASGLSSWGCERVINKRRTILKCESAARRSCPQIFLCMTRRARCDSRLHARARE